MKKKNKHQNEINLGLDGFSDYEKIYEHLSFSLDDLKENKNMKNGKAKLDYIDFEMYKFIF